MPIQKCNSIQPLRDESQTLSPNKSAFVFEWEKIPTVTSQHLVESLPRREKAVREGQLSLNAYDF